MRTTILSLFLFISFCATAQDFYLFVGTYTNKFGYKGSKGIYVYKFNANDGSTQWVSNTDSIMDPSYITLSSDGKYLYAVNETNRPNPSTVSALSFDKSTGKLTLINQQPTGGQDPCYVAVNKDNTWVTVANYSGGSLKALPVGEDGSLGENGQLIQLSGRSVNANRQKSPHVHQTVFSPDEKYLFAPDLGSDKVMTYKFNPADQQPLTPAEPPYTAVTPGNGPRHLTFHPNKRFAYLIEEMSGTVGVYKYNSGKLTLIQHLATHPSTFKGTLGSAEIEVSPDGKFLYASNRGDENNIAIFSINQSTGKVQLKGYQSTLGKAPRHFILDPSGNYLIVANQDTDNIVIFKRNKQTGMLKETGKQIKLSMPVCLQLMKTEE